MQCFTKALSPPKLRPSGGVRFNGASWSQVFQKSAWMVEAAPEESVTCPEVVGMRKLALMVSVGTGMGWVEGHRLVPSLLRTLRAMWDLWSALSSRWPPVLGFLATQSWKMMRKPSTPLGVPFGANAVTIGQEDLEPGDRILLYTDGVTEARTADGKFFDADRLAEFLEREAADGRPTPETLRRLRHAILTHQNGQLQDDATALLVEWRRDTEQALLPETVEA